MNHTNQGAVPFWLQTPQSAAAVTPLSVSEPERKEESVPEPVVAAAPIAADEPVIAAEPAEDEMLEAVTPEESEESEEYPPEEEKLADISPDAKKKEFDEAEAKRKAEWDAKQAEKKAKDQAALNALAAMSDADIQANSAKRVGADTERLTRRNMKVLVTDHVQALCAADPNFARKVMHPRKNMINCFKYINRKAKDFLEQEMKENGEQASGGYGGDVPDDICYQWAVDYFNDPDAEEDKDKDDKFVPKTYYGGSSSKAKKPDKKKKEEKKPAPASNKAVKPAEKKDAASDCGQMDLFGLSEVA